MICSMSNVHCITVCLMVRIVWLNFCMMFGWNELLNICSLFLLLALLLFFPVLRTLLGHKANICSLDFHPFGSFVASGSLDTNIKVKPSFPWRFPSCRSLFWRMPECVLCQAVASCCTSSFPCVWAGVFASACEICACIFSGSSWVWLLCCGMWLWVRCQPRPGVSQHRCSDGCGLHLLHQAGI